MGKGRTVGLLALSVLLAKSVWFSASAVVPAFGIVSMLRLRALPEAERMAGGRR